MKTNPFNTNSFTLFIQRLTLVIFICTLNFNSFSQNSEPQKIEAGKEISEFMRKYPDDDYSKRAKRIINYFEASQIAVTPDDQVNRQNKMQELGEIKAACAFINNRVEKGDSFESAKQKYLEAKNKKSRESKSESDDVKPAFTVPEN
jgi:hypothetical protein